VLHAGGASARIELKGVSKAYPGGIEAVSGVDLAVGEGEFLAVVGPSGSGKSTLLRLVAGLEAPDAGSVWIGGRDASGLAPSERDVAMVFQDQVPYPHLNVFENIAFGLRARRRPAAEVRSRVEETAGLLGLGDCLARSPRALSGGQRRRVVLGRAMARRPALLLLDEPFSGLDAPLRSALRDDVIGLHRRSGTTTILVTHDQAEALAMGDRVAVVDRGRLVQLAHPLEVYDRPASRFVARFIGSPPMNILPCEVHISDEGLRLRIPGVEPEAALAVPLAAPWAAPLVSRGPGAVELGLRPEHLLIPDRPDPSGLPSPLAGEGQGGGTTARPPFDRPLHPGHPPQLGAEDGIRQFLRLEPRIRRVEPLGHETRASLALGPHLLEIRLPPHVSARSGDPLPIALDLCRACWFDPRTGACFASPGD
jgi:multiple sugar transport system ATP-binding protein